MKHVAMVTFQDLSKHSCSTEVVMYVCELHLLVGCCYCRLYPFHPGLSGATFLICEHHLLVGCVITSYNFLMVLVDFCFRLGLYLFTDSTQCHILVGTRPWFCVCGRCQLGNNISGNCVYGGAMELPETHSEVRNYLLITNWALIIEQLMIGYLSMIIN